VVAPVDAGQLAQVLSNLIVNAVHASPRAGEVVVSALFQTARPPANIGGPEAPFACLRVRDRGAGISEADLVHIFEPFFTTKEVGRGTGLGLPVAAGIVREHGGWIDVASAPGEGSTFSVFLPLGA
jgi:signal transduction histidine kinase